MTLAYFMRFTLPFPPDQDEIRDDNEMKCSINPSVLLKISSWIEKGLTLLLAVTSLELSTTLRH